MDILVTILTFLAPIASAFGGWVFGKRKTNAEAITSEMDNVEKALRIYRDIVTDLDLKVKRLEESITRLQGRLNEVEEENRKLKRDEKH